MGFTVFRAVMTILICCFLLLLFVLPSAYLKAFSEDAEALLSAAETALIRGDSDAAAPYTDALADLVRERMPVLERFLNHTNVDSLDTSVAVAHCAVRAGEPGTAAEALAEARSILERIRGIELFSWNNLL